MTIDCTVAPMTLRSVQTAIKRLTARVRLVHASRAYTKLHLRLSDGVNEPTLNNVISQLATQTQIESAVYRAWADRLKLPPTRHRKHWEFAFILQALLEQGLLQEGRRGLGFGVGKEPLAAMMALLGCEVVGSDAAPEYAIAAGWGTHDEHASSLSSLNEKGICPDDVFAERASFRIIDMNSIPADARGFDFCWSSCAFEHLGSIEQGLAFVEASLDCLLPGGLAVHTTEFNLSSDTLTVERGPTVIFRHRDIEQLVQRLRAAGHHVEVNYHPGNGQLDRFVDLPPFQQDPHIKLILGKFITTSIGLVVTKAG